MDQLIEKDVTIESVLSQEQSDAIQNTVKSIVNELAFDVKIESLPPAQEFISIHRSEWERRMDEYAKMGQSMPFGDLGLKKQSLVINANNELALKVLNLPEENQKDTIQFCIDLAMLEKQQLKGEALERFIKKAKNFIG